VLFVSVFPPEGEKQIGMTVFLTSEKGIGGKIKVHPNDFIVEEHSIPPPKHDGKFVIAKVKSVNWETFHLLCQLSQKMRISSHMIGIAGTKDKRAVTTQLMSFKTSVNTVKNIRIKDVEITDYYQSNRPIMWGDHIGNTFQITIRNTQKNIHSQIPRILDKILDTGGFPNFFGVQRFGVSRPITHIVGKNIIDGNFKQAVFTYICNPLPGEGEESYKARTFLEQTGDFKKSLDIYPPYLLFERLMISHLVHHPNDWIGALLSLPHHLLQMFIHSYQSYLFNLIVSQRIKENLPLNKAIVGDVILPIRNNRIMADREGIPVTDDNLKKVNCQIKKQRAFVSSILPGFETSFGRGKMGKIEQKIITDHVALNKFVIPDIPQLTSRGFRRSLLAPLKKLDYALHQDHVIMQFALPKGCYATCLLREFMKATPSHYQ
jgi:tRNA pseudouridine13 synthase